MKHVICPNCKEKRVPIAPNATEATCQHCATTWELTVSGWIRRIKEST